MNGFQKSVLWLAIVGAVAMGLLPPWKYTSDFKIDDFSDHSERAAGYAPLWNPPALARNPILDHPTNHRYAYLGSGIRLDMTRLAVQWIVLACLAAGAFVTLHRRRDERTVAGQAKSVASPAASHTVVAPVAAAAPVTAIALGVSVARETAVALGTAVRQRAGLGGRFFAPYRIEPVAWIAVLAVVTLRTLLTESVLLSRPDFGGSAAVGSLIRSFILVFGCALIASYIAWS